MSQWVLSNKESDEYFLNSFRKIPLENLNFQEERLKSSLSGRDFCVYSN